MASVDMSPSKNFMDRFKQSHSTDKKKKKHAFGRKSSGNGDKKGKIFGRMKQDSSDDE